jgi:hypothetical protein
MEQTLLGEQEIVKLLADTLEEEKPQADCSHRAAYYGRSHEDFLEAAVRRADSNGSRPGVLR